MKAFLLPVLALSTALLASPAFASFPTPDEMKANFDTCENSDQSWDQRFGRYVVAYDVDDAARICSAQTPAQMYQLAACAVDGGFLYAGYYCQYYPAMALQ